MIRIRSSRSFFPPAPKPAPSVSARFLGARVGAALLAGALLAGGLSACAPQVQAPADAGVCWHMTADKAGKIKFMVLSRNQPDLEHCAANIEAMRLKFLGLGGSNQEVDGAYQGQFIFDDPRGIFTAEGLNKTPYLALVRTGDGRLAVPGAVSQPQ